MYIGLYSIIHTLLAVLFSLNMDDMVGKVRSADFSTCLYVKLEPSGEGLASGRVPRRVLRLRYLSEILPKRNIYVYIYMCMYVMHMLDDLTIDEST